MKEKILSFSYSMKYTNLILTIIAIGIFLNWFATFEDKYVWIRVNIPSDNSVMVQNDTSGTVDETINNFKQEKEYSLEAFPFSTNSHKTVKHKCNVCLEQIRIHSKIITIFRSKCAVNYSGGFVGSQNLARLRFCTFVYPSP